MTNKKYKNVSTFSVLMANKIGRMVTYLDGLLTMKLFNILITWSCKVKNYYISSTKVPVTTKVDRMITYLDGLLPIKACEP